jgi:dTDP-glucose pyrophosphorylase
MPLDFRNNLITATSKIIETLRIIDGHGVPIGLVHSDGCLLGTVTDGDIRRGLLAGLSLNEPVTKVMNASPKTVRENTPDSAILALMLASSIPYVPVIGENNRIVDLKLQKDLLLAATGKEAPSGRDGFESLHTVSPTNIPVVIMAGGEGKRLQPLTLDRPKPMVEVGGQPILQTIIERFVQQGFTKFHLSVNYRREMIKDYFGAGEKWGADISYLDEDRALGTAGSLSLMPERPATPVIVMNGDLVTQVNFRQMLAFHHEHKASATMAVSQIHFTVPYGVVTTNGMLLTSVEEKPQERFWVNAGIYILAPDMLAQIPRDTFLNITDLFGLQLDHEKSRRKVLTAFPLREYWIDVGRIEDLERAQHDVHKSETQG